MEPPRSAAARRDEAEIVTGANQNVHRITFTATEHEEVPAINDIARQFDVTRSAISQHLRVLQDARLLQSQRSGRQNFYAIDPHGLTVLRTYLDGFWDEVLGAFQAAAIRESRGSRQT